MLWGSACQEGVGRRCIEDERGADRGRDRKLLPRRQAAGCCGARLARKGPHGAASKTRGEPIGEGTEAARLPHRAQANSLSGAGEQPIGRRQAAPVHHAFVSGWDETVNYMASRIEMYAIRMVSSPLPDRDSVRYMVEQSGMKRVAGKPVLSPQIISEPETAHSGREMPVEGCSHRRCGDVL